MFKIQKKKKKIQKKFQNSFFFTTPRTINLQRYLGICFLRSSRILYKCIKK